MSDYAPDHSNPSIAELDAARILLTRLGLTAEDLLDAPVPRPEAPTFRDYIAIVSAGARPGTRRVHSSYWNRIDKHWGERRIDEPSPSQIRQLLVDLRHAVGSVCARRRSSMVGLLDRAPRRLRLNLDAPERDWRAIIGLKTDVASRISAISQPDSTSHILVGEVGSLLNHFRLKIS